MEKNNLYTIIDIGCGSGFKLIDILGKYDTIGIETEPCFTFLKEKYPEHQFVLIMGADNLGSLHLWKNYAQILAEYELYVYKRPSFEPGELASHPRVKIFEAPPLDISATYIRDCIKAGKSVRYLLPEPVWEYLESGTLYR